MNGILNVLKPPGMTSHDVVSYVKRLLKVNKVGHTGTLDPGAAGVLPICIGKATRVTDYLINDKKSYRVEMELGLKSDTLDKYGIIESVKIPYLNDEKVIEAFNKFKGRIEQMPPMFSAVKQGGKKLYELARQGIEVERKQREVFIYDLNILFIRDCIIMFDVTCSKGTYIRTLCSDIGKSLGCDAIMTFLLRTKTGPFMVSKSTTLDELNFIMANNAIEKVMHPIDSALEDYDRVFIDDSTSKKVVNGVGFSEDSILKYEHRVYDDELLIYDNNSNFIAIGVKADNTKFIKIDKVFV